jgi:hypothetical protein
MYTKNTQITEATSTERVREHPASRIRDYLPAALTAALFAGVPTGMAALSLIGN